MDSSKPDFSPPFAVASTPAPGTIYHSVIDAMGRLVVHAGPGVYSAHIAQMVADALNGATASPLVLRGALYDLATAIEANMKGGGYIGAGARGDHIDQLGRALAAANTYLRGPAPTNTAAHRLVSTIEATGGLVAYRDGTHAPLGDRDWIDLGDAYIAACAELKREPVIGEDLRHE